jgi:Ni,Fe-hydrogenase I large subunit
MPRSIRIVVPRVCGVCGASHYLKSPGPRGPTRRSA